MPKPNDYVIWSNEHRGWWKPGACGYTPHLAHAGIYSRSTAILTAQQARGGWRQPEPPNEIPVLLIDALESGLLGKFGTPAVPSVCEKCGNIICPPCNHEAGCENAPEPAGGE